MTAVCFGHSPTFPRRVSASELLRSGARSEMEGAGNGFNGLLRALPGDRTGDRAFLSPSPRNAKHCRELTSASRRQDHTASPSVPPRTPCEETAATAPCPASVAIASRPSLMGQDARRRTNDLPVGATGKFHRRKSQPGWNGRELTPPQAAPAQPARSSAAARRRARSGGPGCNRSPSRAAAERLPRPAPIRRRS